MIAYDPQPLDQLRARYFEALKPLVDVAAVMADENLSPGKRDLHVFDFEDGLRLIVSRDTNTGNVWLHFSASMRAGSPIERKLIRKARVSGGDAAALSLQKIAGGRFVAISDEKLANWTFAGFSRTKGVPHWFRMLAEAEKAEVPTS